MPLSKERNRERMRQARVQPNQGTVELPLVQPRDAWAVVLLDVPNYTVQPKYLPNAPDGRYHPELEKK